MAAGASRRPLRLADAPIRTGDIHPTVLSICRRLREHGHYSLLVGGAVRDLLLGRRPKDFDMATSARPETVKRLFRNARIIGRRFRLVQLRYPSMSVEISTFRSDTPEKARGMIRRDNRFGSWEEDLRRRDFTINALFFDPLDSALYHLPGALEDLKAGLIRTIKRPGESFTEDPVRMLRAARFKVRLDFRIAGDVLQAIRECGGNLSGVSRHRLADETQRFLAGGQALAAFGELQRLGLLGRLLQLREHGWFFDGEAARSPLPRLTPFLRRMDRWAAEGNEPIPPTVALLGLLWALAGDGRRSYLTGAAPGRKSGASRGTEAGMEGRLASLFSRWGMLNGQVGPALLIVDAARFLTGRMGRAFPEGMPLPAGSREAWLLLGMLQDDLSLPAPFIAAGLAQVDRLPDLPILDHPRPPGRRRFRRRMEKGRKGHPGPPASSARRGRSRGARR